MNEELVRQARRALRRLAYPLVRILLRYGVSFEEFERIAKRAYVDVAAREFSLTPRPSSKSRIALLTGLNRREVARVLDQATAAREVSATDLNRCARVVASWLRESRFHDASGKPALLPLEGEQASFTALVQRHGSDIPVMAVLRELKSSGAVTETEDGRVCLVTSGYIPTDSELDKLELLGSDVAALLDTINNNLVDPAHARFQRKVSFPRLSEQGVAILQQRVREKGQELLVQLDQELAEHDQPADQPGAFAGLGMYVFIQDSEEGE